MNNLQAQTAYVGGTEITQVRKGDRLVLAPNGNKLWYDSNQLPSLDLRFAENKSLVDATTGSNLVDFTRASSGTYVGSDGLIKTATTNLLLRSEEFDNSWARAGILAFGSGSTADVTTAPNGVDSADLITEDTATSSVHRVIQSGLTVSAVSCTVSVYAKRANGTRNLEINANALTNARAVFDLGTGTVGEISSGTAAIQSVSNGWYRCSVTGVSSGTTTSVFLQLATSTTASSSTYTGDGTSGIYLWGAQLEQSSTVGEYVKTTSTINSAPRFDHDPTTGESLGLLVEESRTNLALNSENLSTANWDVNGSATIASGFTSPRGDSSAYLVENATSLVDTSGSDNLRKNNNTDTSLGSLPAGTYTVSGYVKANGATTIFYPRTRLSNSGVNSDGGINISTNWQRFTRTVTATVTDNLRLIFAADSIDGFYLWGLQVEAGSFPTSYIPTEGSTVTRAADVASISGSNFSSWYRQEEGTVFMGFRTIADNPSIFSVSDGGFSNRHQTYMSNGNVIVRTAALNVASNNGLGAALLNQNNKAAFAFSSGTTSGSLNGNINTTTQAIPSNLNVAYFGASANGTVGNPVVLQRITFWPARLPNDTLQTITQ